jgi:hypothetical protein
MSVLTVGQCAKEIASELGVPVHPKILSDGFYQGVLDSTCCPVVGGRRLIPREQVPRIIETLQHAGKLKRRAA